jgi:hypothetical protein
MNVKKPETVKDALMMSARAAVKRERADYLAERGDYHASWERAEADEMDEAAGKFLDIGSQALHVTGPVRPGNGGELLVVKSAMQVDVPGMVDTVRERPSMLAAEASESRLRLTGNAMVLAVDMAQSIQARNSPEKALSHQLAMAHRLGMLAAGKASDLLERHGTLNQATSIEAARQMNAAARMFGAYQDALVALDKFRRGGKQTVRVVHQHVAVAPGGQAVVAAGNVKGRGHKTRGRGRK